MSMTEAGCLEEASVNGIPRIAAWRRYGQAAVAHRSFFLPVALLLLAVAGLYGSVLRDLWTLWFTRDDYSHGFLIPLISLYLIIVKWPVTHRPIRPSPILGWGLVLLSLTVLFVGVAGGIITLSSISLIGMSMGLTLSLFGLSYFRALLFPLAYLVFMTPLLDIIVEPLQQPLQVLAANVASLTLDLLGVPTYREGTFIEFSNGVLEVAVQCSGAGYVIAVLAIGFPLVALTLARWRNRLLLLGGALVMSLVANWVRIVLIGTIGYVSGWGPHVHGPLHILQGMMVYWIGFGVLFTGAWILAQAERGIRPSHRLAPRASSVMFPPWHMWRRRWWAAMATLAMAAVYLHTYDLGAVAAKQSLASLPLTIGQWTASETERAMSVVNIIGADQELSRMYRATSGSTVRLYIAYLESQRQGKELVNYLTVPLHRETVETRLPIGETNLNVNLGFVGNTPTVTPLLFWYAIHGESFTDRYRAKAATVAQALLHNGSNGALVVITGDPQAGAHETTADVRQFAEALFPLLQSYLP